MLFVSSLQFVNSLLGSIEKVLDFLLKRIFILKLNFNTLLCSKKSKMFNN